MFYAQDTHTHTDLIIAITLSIHKLANKAFLVTAVHTCNSQKQHVIVHNDIRFYLSPVTMTGAYAGGDGVSEHPQAEV